MATMNTSADHISTKDRHSSHQQENNHNSVTESIPIDMVAVTGDLVGYQITL